MKPRLRLVLARPHRWRGAKERLQARREAEKPQDAATEAFDAIASMCGCPHWDYPGQVVRDVEAFIRQRDAALDVVKSGDRLIKTLVAVVARHECNICTEKAAAITQKGHLRCLKHAESRAGDVMLADIVKASSMPVPSNQYAVSIDAERHLKNLLARIHLDGGHHTEKVGINESVKEADNIVSRLIADQTAEREACTLWLLDRAGQYNQGDAMVACLEDRANEVAHGRAAEALATGELDDLRDSHLARVARGEKP